MGGCGSCNLKTDLLTDVVSIALKEVRPDQSISNPGSGGNDGTLDGTDTGLFIINGGRNSYDPVEILAKKLRKLNETNILVITILESQKLS